MRAALSALLAALAEGAGGGAGQALAEAADGSGRPEALRDWGDRVAELLGGDPMVAGAVAAAMERYAPGSAADWYGGDHSDFRGGVFLREVVGVQVVIQQGAAAPEALASLPPRPGGFTGREEETAELLRALDDSAAVLVTAVSGLGGIGKTALAVETAHLACGKGWFPGGVLFLDLHGYDEQPVSADQALQSLLRALGVEPEHIPATADDRAVLYRSVLAQRGAVLVLADNASSPDQVRPLLPGEGRHRVLVTSRDRLPQLGARLVPLDQLTPEEARRVLDLALRIADPEDSRVADDAEAAGQLADLCGHLPLALQIAAALLAEDPGMPVAELVGELAVSRDRLVHLDDGERSVRAAFELSYRRLPPEQARLLRLLALAPGAEVSDEIAATLMGAGAPPLRDLRALARAHLVERGHGRGWWRLHDLVRVFGVGMVAGCESLREESEAARERLLRFYCQVAEEADQRLRWLPGREMPERFSDRGQALAWLDGERTGLVATVLWAWEERLAGLAAGLAERLAEYLSWRRYIDDWITVCRAARDAAHRAGDRPHEAAAWTNLGNALGEAGRAEDSVDAHSRARDLYQAATDHRREAMAWNNLGLALREAGRADEAVDAHIRARALFQTPGDRHTAGDPHREAMAWNNLGLALREAGRAEEAVDAHIRARALFQTAGDRHREATAWNNLGIALGQAGRAEEAIQAFSTALDAYLEFEDWFRGGQTLQNLAFTHERAHRPSEARALYLQAADAYTRANSLIEATRSRTQAAALESPHLTAAPTDKPAPASPPARTADSAPPSPPPPGAPDTAVP
ncbi:tetratricopeptide repeat protein [Streptomyces sp. NPDC058683]|uniref:tetratricopeptide repeat protein n=1 Tax=Streptomyces sp. NPDC058683 TaxID=3346597 RepID=UPI003667D7CA